MPGVSDCLLCKLPKSIYCREICKTCYNKEYRNNKYHTDPIWKQNKLTSSRWVKLKARFGITESQYNEMLYLQNGVCAICLNPETHMNGRTSSYKVKNLAVDHCHVTGKIRGLLCSKCNNSLGHYESIKNSAEQYLRKYS